MSKRLHGLSFFFGFFSYLLILSNLAQAERYFYVDPDYQGPSPDGSAAHPWLALKSDQFDKINQVLALDNVTVFFSAREAFNDSDEESQEGILIEREDSSANRLTLDAMTKYNTNDENPQWSDYKGTSRFKIMAGVPMKTGKQKRNYVTIRGFKLVGGTQANTGQILYYWGGDHIVIEDNELTHSEQVEDGPGLMFGYSHHPTKPTSGSCTDITIRNNIVHDTYGECIYIGGAHDTGNPSHSNVLVEGNLLYNCGKYGMQGDCIDPKDGISGLQVKDNICYDGTGTAGPISGIASTSPLVATGNVIANMPNIGISAGAYWGSGPSGSVIANNLIINNGTYGIYIGSAEGLTVSNISILHNTIVGNGSSALNLAANNTGIIDGITIKNNIHVNNHRGVSGWGSIYNWVFTNNNLYNNNKDYGSGPIVDQTGKNGNISADPKFPSVGLMDYSLSADSPCIDSGTDAGIYTDIDGIARPIDEGFDMGCYEYTGSAPYCVGAKGVVFAGLNKVFETSVKGIDPDQGELQVAYSGLCPGMEANPESGTIGRTELEVLFAWTPTENDKNKVCDIDIKFTDEQALERDCSFSVVVTHNQAPHCDIASASLTNIACQGAETLVALDGSASSDPEGDELSFNWSTDCTNATLNNKNDAKANLTLLEPAKEKNVACSVFLEVSDGILSDSCTAELSAQACEYGCIETSYAEQLLIQSQLAKKLFKLNKSLAKKYVRKAAKRKKARVYRKKSVKKAKSFYNAFIDALSTFPVQHINCANTELCPAVAIDLNRTALDEASKKLAKLAKKTTKKLRRFGVKPKKSTKKINKKLKSMKDLLDSLPTTNNVCPG